jgi:LPXTG-motif cell wall-anchored protein
MTVSAIAGVAVTALAGPAFAHVEVSADKTQAGATDVTLTFNGEAENPKAGIRSERVVLPTGIAPAEVTLVSAPAGWKFTSAADGFTVAGKALKVGTDAVWKVRIAKLPDGQTRLSFKTLETYGNGDISRWIEIQLPGQDEPDNPAPLLTLKPGAVPGTAVPSGAASSFPATEPSATAPLTARTQPPVTTSSSSSTWWIWVVVVALVVVAGGLFVLRRRRSSDTN